MKVHGGVREIMFEAAVQSVQHDFLSPPHIHLAHRCTFCTFSNKRIVNLFSGLCSVSSCLPSLRHSSPHAAAPS